MNTKQCRKCKTDKDLSEFGKDRECKMVLDAYTVQPLGSARITVEEVVELVKQNNW